MDDATAFGAVADAYKLPKDSDQAKADRSAAIAKALVGASRPPADVIRLSERLVDLGEVLLPIGNRNVITDVAAAAEAARAAATTARVNVEINVGGIEDDQVRAELLALTVRVDEIAARADQVTHQVREVIK